MSVTSRAKSGNTYFCEIAECVLWLSGYPWFSIAYFGRQVSAVALKKWTQGEGLHKAHTQGSFLNIPTLLLEAAAMDKSLQCLAQWYFTSGYSPPTLFKLIIQASAPPKGLSNTLFIKQPPPLCPCFQTNILITETMHNGFAGIAEKSILPYQLQ